MRKTTCKRALAIVRVSTAEQAHEERYSIPHQRAHITEECKHRRFELVHFFEFIQSGAKVLSRSSKERAEIFDFIKNYNINVVIVHELDRLARSMLDTLLFVDQLDKLGVAFVSIHDSFDTTTAQGQLQMHILSAFSEYFRKQLAAKVIGGMVERAKKGKHMGRRPFGYKISPTGFDIDKKEAKIVKLIFSMYLEQNLGLRSIADHLNSMGVKSRRGNTWSHVSVREILENEVYTGTFIWSDIRVENNHPAIIDRTTWDKVQGRRRRKKELGARSHNSIFLLSGLLRCGSCNGAAMVGRTTRKLGKYIYRYYVCNNYASKGLKTCPGGYYRADEIEKIVREDIEDFVKQRPAEIRHETIPSDIGLINEQIKLKRRELAALNRMLNRAAEAYERGVYELDWLHRRKTKITEEKTLVQKEIRYLEKQSENILSHEEMAKHTSARILLAKSLLDEKDRLKVKAKLQEFIASVVVNSGDDIIIYYRS